MFSLSVIGSNNFRPSFYWFKKISRLHLHNLLPDIEGPGILGHYLDSGKLIYYIFVELDAYYKQKQKWNQTIGVLLSLIASRKDFFDLKNL